MLGFKSLKASLIVFNSIYYIYYMYTTHLFHPYFSGHVGYISISTMANNVEMSMGMKLCLSYPGFTSFLCITQIEIVELYHNFILNYFRETINFP